MTTRNWSVVRVLRDRAAGLYLAGVVVSGFGTSALWPASGIWVKDLTGSDGLAALCLFAMWAPSLAGPLLGTLADLPQSRLRSTGRCPHRRKPLLIWSNLTLAALLTALVTVDSAGRVWILFAVLFVYGAVGVVQDAAEAALVATAVDPSLLGDFNGLRMTANEGMKLIAPLAGAGLYAAYGGPSVALLDAVTFVLATLLYACVRVRESTPPPPATGVRARTAEGAAFLWRHDRLRPLVLAGGTTMLLSGLSAATLYAVVEGLGHSPAYAGPLYVLQGAGSVAVGLVSGPLLRRLGERRFAAYGIALTGAATALRAVPADLAVLGSTVAAGTGLPCVLIAGLTAVQRETPEELLGRTAATANTLMFAPTAIGLAVGAALVELVGHRVLLPLYALALLLTAALLLQRRASASRTASRSPSDANPA
ncbi:MFS transporter [Streptomyces turgidiscabies]|uniref:Putative membrane protein n=1 Tax=Streptomyces turgidiscabies (strain Car8) TaxID=698760 RepID=L7EY54_STRT8|nr:MULTISPECIES: MFS transporter [Streptomyces]ELP63320.1 putative membrane protein [Streptomyces turgidiscabies Car8]MDX3498922.1 MFS transporter [Streptomyces turgidiscabies]GAQ77446.1 major Facilitator Superfamily protein [Streptomyces turgidiscabies]